MPGWSTTARVMGRHTRHSARFALVLVFCGCAEPAADPPDIVPISGRVTCHGEPIVAGALVQFIPTSAGRSAYGPIQEDGRYTMTTNRSGDGAHVANHLIRIYPSQRDLGDGEREDIPLPCTVPELHVVVTAETRVVDIELADGGTVITR